MSDFPVLHYQQVWTVGNKLASVTWEDRGWTCKVAFGYDGDGVRLWKREYLPRPLGVVVRLTLYAGYGFEEGFVEELVPHEAGGDGGAEGCVWQGPCPTGQGGGGDGPGLYGSAGGDSFWAL